MLAKSKKPIKSKNAGGESGEEEECISLKLRVSRIKMTSYESYHHQVFVTHRINDSSVCIVCFDKFSITFVVF